MVKVSVVMPAYNAEKYLDESILSILKQTYTDFEFIIVNDGSTDGTTGILDYYAALDSRIIVVNQKNSGVTAALNAGIAVASNSKYIARMDADDISVRNRLEEEVTFLDLNKDYVVVGTDYNIINRWGSVLRHVRVPYEDDDLRLMLCVGSPLAHGSVMFRKAAYQKVGGYRLGGRSAEDYDLWTRLANEGKLYVLPKTLFKWRLGDDNVTTVYNKDISANAKNISSDYIQASPSPRFSTEQFHKKSQLYSKARYNLLLNTVGKIIAHQIKRGDVNGTKNLRTLASLGKEGRFTIIDRIVKIATLGKKHLRHE